MQGRATVVDEAGNTGRLLTRVKSNGHEGTVTIALDERRQVVVPTECLEFDDGSVRLEGRFDDFDVLESDAHNTPTAGAESVSGEPGAKRGEGRDGDDLRIPVAREKVSAEGRSRPVGRVRIDKRVEEEDVTIEEQLEFDEVDIERVSVDRVVDQPPSIRREDDTLIVPVVEERLVKQTVLVEEVHITRRQRTEEISQSVPLRREVVDVERERLDSDNEREDSSWQNRPS
ncbi:MAG: YsnF/AvaK domain-containing protein [Persicimonas sp.]